MPPRGGFVPLERGRRVTGTKCPREVGFVPQETLTAVERNVVPVGAAECSAEPTQPPARTETPAETLPTQPPLPFSGRAHRGRRADDRPHAPPLRGVRRGRPDG